MKRLLATLFLVALVGAAPAAAPTGMVHTPDVDLAYWVYGHATSATPVIAVNGGPGLSHVYMVQNDLWMRVARDREVVLYDQRGTGRSTHLKAGASQSMDEQVADLEAIRAHLGFAKFELVGDSYGGLLAMAYAAAHPEHVASLVISDSAPPRWKDLIHLLPDVFPDVEEQDAALAKKLGDTNAGAQAQLRDHFRMIFYSEAKRDTYLNGASDLGYNPKVGEAVSNATANLDLTSKLPHFSFPTLVITGRYDMNVAPLTAWRMYRAIPGAKIVFFEQSGHLPAYEEPEKYLRTLDAFFAGH